MGRIINENRWFFIGFACWLLICTYELFSLQKGDFLLDLNEEHNSAADLFFRCTTWLGDGIFAALVILSLLFVRFRVALFVLMSVCVTSIIIGLLKSWFNLPRPALYFEGMELQLVDGVRMYYHNSFPSGHTGVAFSIFPALALWSGRKRFFAILMLMIAILIGISRIYMAQHFLMDVVAGSLIGVSVTLFYYYFFISIFRGNTVSGKLDGSLLILFKGKRKSA